MLKISSIFIAIICFSQFYCRKERDSDDLFVPSKEWKVIRKGQKIPRGLHVRINFETGVTEAKILNDNDKTVKNNQALTTTASISPPLDGHGETNELLKSDKIKQIKDRFRNYDELINNLIPRTETELITLLLEKYRLIKALKGKSEALNVLHVLEDLEYLSHQYDNAIEFVNQNGFDQIIYVNLNASDTRIKRETLKLLGSLMQNNIIPKVHALKTGCVSILLRLLSFDGDQIVKSRTAAALGALLRNYPQAQHKFLEHGGLAVISKCFDGNDNIKLQIKFVTLMSDLIVENRLFNDNVDDNQHHMDNDRSNLSDIETRIEDSLDWCRYLSELLRKLVIIDRDDHDSIEKCLTAMHVVKIKCGLRYRRDLLVNLERRYRELAALDRNSDDFTDKNGLFFSIMQDICRDILNYVDDNKSYKTEL